MTRPDEQDRAEPQPPSHLSTRAAPPRPRRLSRKVIIALAGSGTCLIAAALAYGLGEGRTPKTVQEQVTIKDHKSDLLASAPRDYSDVAMKAAGGLGPPPAGGTETEPTAALDRQPIAPQTKPVDTTKERRLQQAESARTSKLFADYGGSRASAPMKREDASASSSSSTASSSPTAPAATPASRRVSFLSGSTEPTINSGRIVPAPGRYVVTAGSTIGAALITGLSSDLPGQVIAQVTEDVFDSTTGRTRLIPQGSRLIGSYDADASYGQTRVLLVWTRLIFPDGRSLDLDRLLGTDGSGKSGLTDRVDNHWGTILKAGLLSTLLGLGSAASEIGKDGEIATAIRDSAGQTIGRAGDRIVEKQLGVQPTITVRPGARVRVLVSRDLVLEPWPNN